MRPNTAPASPAEAVIIYFDKESSSMLVRKITRVWYRWEIKGYMLSLDLSKIMWKPLKTVMDTCALSRNHAHGLHVLQSQVLGTHKFLDHSVQEIFNLLLVHCFKLYTCITHLQIQEKSLDMEEAYSDMPPCCLCTLLCSWSSFLYNPNMHSMGLNDCSLNYHLLLYGSVSQGLGTTKFTNLIGWNGYWPRSRFSHLDWHLDR